jgi:ribonuclease R
MSRGKFRPNGTNSLEDRIKRIFNSNPSRTYGFREVLSILQLKKEKDKVRVKEIFDTLLIKENIKRLPNGSFQSNSNGLSDDENEENNIETTPTTKSKPQPKQATIIEGRVDFVNPRFGYVIPTDTTLNYEVWVNVHHMNYAFDGDIVRVRVFKDKPKGKNLEGEIIEILQRKRTEFVGRIEIGARHAFVIPDARRMHSDIFVHKNDIGEAKHGDKVLVTIDAWPSDDDKNPQGSVKTVLGKVGENETEMHAIMLEYGLPWTFSDEVNKAAEAIPSTFTEEEIAKRRDFRETLTFTIDPEDAKDFDDALSFKPLENGNYEIGIHIADVSFYVTPDSVLDKEALSRATSVYLVDRCVPMLPEHLSNFLCSLRPNEDKYTFSAVFEIDNEGKVHNEWFGRTIIHSKRRFTYEEAQKVIETGKGDHAEVIVLMNNIAKKMRAERFRQGAISFETIEVKFKLDEKGKPLAVIPKVRKDAHKMIEDYMLLANKKVAEYVHFMKKGKEKNTMVFRIHEHPNTDKLKSLAVFARRFGHKLQLDNEAQVASELNKLTEEVEGKPEQNVLQSLAIRTMSKAKYTTEPEIHFGLAFKHYTHFTSPIRRYPDVMVHRLLQHYLEGGKSAEKELYEGLCEHSSQMEKVAAEAERSSIKYKQVEFMQETIGKDFDGIVSGITEFGIFVEITETKCEGMVRMADMTDDYYEVDMENYRVFGKRNKRMITLGDLVRVRVKNTNLEKRSIDLELLKA